MPNLDGTFWPVRPIWPLWPPPVGEPASESTTSDAERIWWKRIMRAVDRQGPPGRHALADWAHGMRLLVGATRSAEQGLTGAAVSAERVAAEYETGCRRLSDGLGRALGVGRRP